MRTIIAGSRTCTNIQVLEEALKGCQWLPTVVLCGKARGADTLGHFWADEHDVPVEFYPADWDTYGKAAGMIRNQQMANNAEALIALWDGKSTGTKNMIDEARKRNLQMRIYIYE